MLSSISTNKPFKKFNRFLSIGDTKTQPSSWLDSGLNSCYSYCTVGFVKLFIGPRAYQQIAVNVIECLQYPQLNK